MMKKKKGGGGREGKVKTSRTNSWLTGFPSSPRSFLLYLYISETPPPPPPPTEQNRPNTKSYVDCYCFKVPSYSANPHPTVVLPCPQSILCILYCVGFPRVTLACYGQVSDQYSYKVMSY